MLKLRRATVAQAGGAGGPEQELVIERDGKRRAAIVDVALLGAAAAGDEVIVNVEALDLGLGSGGFDIVHVNLTRGLSGEGTQGADVMKLCYSSMQHAVSPVERDGPAGAEATAGLVAVLALHGQLAPVAWALSRAAPELRVGYVQTEGGALPGGHSRTVRTLRQAGLLADHLTAGQCYGGELEAISVAGALEHGFAKLGWDVAICGPGPGIVGSGTRLGHGGIVALDSAHTSLALGHRTLVAARMSSGEERRRHRGISHHTLTLLDLLLSPVTVALPAGMRSPVGTDLRAGLRAIFGGASAQGTSEDIGEGASRDVGRDTGQLALEVQRPARIARHDWRRAPVDLVSYAHSGLPAETMGRSLTKDPLFFGAALAAGTVLAEMTQEPEEE